MPNFEVETGNRFTTFPLAIKASSWSATLTTISDARPAARQFWPARQDENNASENLRATKFLGSTRALACGCGASPHVLLKRKSSRRRVRRRQARGDAPQILTQGIRESRSNAGLVRNENLQVLDQGIDLAQIFAAALLRLQFAFPHEDRQLAQLDAAARAIILRRACSIRAPPGSRPVQSPGGPRRPGPWPADRCEVFPTPIPATCAGEVSLDLARARLCLIVVIMRLQPAPVLPCPWRTAPGTD